MTTRMLSIELRRSMAGWTGLVVSAVGIFVLFASNPPYGSWMELIIIQREILQLTWPHLWSRSPPPRRSPRAWSALTWMWIELLRSLGRPDAPPTSSWPVPS